MERLQRVIAARGAASRRAAEALITAGRVTVDGQVVTELGTKVDPRTARIRIDGRPLRPQRLRYLLLNKPRGYITTTRDERQRHTVMDLVHIPERVYPVGRLDRTTEGLLLLTNDGDVANRVMHPRYQLDKEYHVVTPVKPPETSMRRIREGVTIDGNRVVPRECRILRETPDGVILKVVLHQGMYHVVRRLMEAAGITVDRLRRVRIGPLSLTGIAPGTWRDLTPGELDQLRQALHLKPEIAPATTSRRGDQRCGVSAIEPDDGESPDEQRQSATRASPGRGDRWPGRGRQIDGRPRPG